MDTNQMTHCSGTFFFLIPIGSSSTDEYSESDSDSIFFDLFMLTSSLVDLLSIDSSCCCCLELDCSSMFPIELFCVFLIEEAFCQKYLYPQLDSEISHHHLIHSDVCVWSCLVAVFCCNWSENE
eukprot:508035_1